MIGILLLIIFAIGTIITTIFIISDNKSSEKENNEYIDEIIKYDCWEDDDDIYGD